MELFVEHFHGQRLDELTDLENYQQIQKGLKDLYNQAPYTSKISIETKMIKNQTYLAIRITQVDQTMEYLGTHPTVEEAFNTAFTDLKRQLTAWKKSRFGHAANP
jgi:ABC-type uncharacterized transport system auxiliary subunit